MFISKAEKDKLHDVIAQLQYQVRSLYDRCEVLSDSCANLTLRLNKISAHKVTENNDIEHIKHERKKAYGREYYHRKKADRLTEEKKSAQQGIIDVKNGVPVTPISVSKGEL
jgi:chromosome segregation ATPase